MDTGVKRYKLNSRKNSLPGLHKTPQRQTLSVLPLLPDSVCSYDDPVHHTEGTFHKHPQSHTRQIAAPLTCRSKWLDRRCAGFTARHEERCCANLALAEQTDSNHCGICSGRADRLLCAPLRLAVSRQIWHSGNCGKQTRCGCHHCN